MSSSSATAAAHVSPRHQRDPTPTHGPSLSANKVTVAEKTFKTLAAISEEHQDIQCIAVSHSSAEATERWIPQVGGTWNVQVIVDEERDLYALWGLGTSSTWYALAPTVLWSAYKLGTTEGIWNRPAESGSKWQTGGAFAVDRLGYVTWSHPSRSADDMPDIGKALESFSGK